LLELCVSALLEDLDEDEVVGALEAEVRVFADEFVGLVLGYHLVTVEWSQNGSWERLKW
jgi:hypothetical protein